MFHILKRRGFFLSASMFFWGLVGFLSSSVHAQNLLRNPDFEEIDAASSFALHWQRSIPATVQGDISIDDGIAASGSRSVKFDLRKSERDSTNVVQTFRLPQALTTPVRGQISCQLYAHALQGVACLVVITTNQEQGKSQWINTGNHNGTFDWRQVSHEMEFNPGTTAITFSFRVRGTGTVWLDKAALNLALDNDQNNAASQGVMTMIDFAGQQNPNTGLPEPWQEKKYHGNENASTVTLEAVDGKMTVLQQWNAGAAKSGFVAVMPEANVAMPAVRLLAEVKTAGQGEATLGLEYINDKGLSLGELLAPGVTGDGWLTIDHTFIIPPGVKDAKILLLNTGPGKVWFAGVRLLPGQDSDKALRLRERVIEAKVFPVSTSPEQLEGVPQFNTFADSPTKLTFHFKGDRQKMVKPALVIDLPADVRLADAITSHPNQWRPEPFSNQPLSRPEGVYRRWRLEGPRGMILARPDQYAYQRRVVLALMPETPQAVRNGHKVFWHLENDGQADIEESFQLNILPPMQPTPNPKRFQFFRWNYEDLALSRDDVLLASLRCIEEAGYNWYIRYANNPRNKEVCEMLATRGWRFKLAGSISDRTIPAGLENALVVDVNGKEVNRLCPELMVNDQSFAQQRDEIIREGISIRNPQPGDVLIMDSEDWQPMDWCFCDRCRTNFARRIGREDVPDAATIKREHPVEWREFRADNAMGKVKIVYDVARKHFPFLQIGDYNYVVDYTNPNYHNRFYSVAKDALRNEKYQDMHLASYYHILDAEAFDMMRVALDTLKKSYYPIVAVDGAGSYLTRDEVLNPRRFRMMCLNAAVTGCPGVSIYPGERLDALFYLAADQAMAEIAACEDFFLDGRRISEVEVTALPYRAAKIQVGGREMVVPQPRWEQYVRHHTWELGSRRLIALLNHHPTLPAFVRIDLSSPWNGMLIKDQVSKMFYRMAAEERSLLVKVPPRDACLLELNPTGKQAEFVPAPSQKEINAAFQQEQQAYLAPSQSSAFQPQKAGGLELAFHSQNDTEPPQLAIITPQQTLVIDAERGGAITGWQMANRQMCPDSSRGQIMADSRLWTPSAAREDQSLSKPCQVLASNINDKTATLTLRRTLETVPIQLDKTYLVPEQGRAFTVQCTLTNVGQQSQTIAFWSRNAINPENLPNPLLDGEFYFPTDQGYQRANRNQESTYVFSQTGQVADLGSARLPAETRAIAGPAYLNFLGVNLHLAFTVSNDQLLAYYLYNGQVTSTQEWVYKPVTLQPGESFSCQEEYQCNEGQAPIK